MAEHEEYIFVNVCPFYFDWSAYNDSQGNYKVVYKGATCRSEREFENRLNHTVKGGCEKCKESKDTDDTTTSSSEHQENKIIETSAVESIEERNIGTETSLNDSAAPPESSQASEEQLTLIPEGAGDIEIAKARSLEQQSSTISDGRVRAPENTQARKEHQSLSDYRNQTGDDLRLRGSTNNPGYNPPYNPHEPDRTSNNPALAFPERGSGGGEGGLWRGAGKALSAAGSAIGLYSSPEPDHERSHKDLLRKEEKKWRNRAEVAEAGIETANERIRTANGIIRKLKTEKASSDSRLQLAEQENEQLRQRIQAFQRDKVTNEQEIGILTRQRDDAIERSTNLMHNAQSKQDAYSVILLPERDDAYWKTQFDDLWDRIRTFANSISLTIPKSQPLVRAEDSALLPGSVYENEIFSVVPIYESTLDDILKSLDGSKKRRFMIEGWIHLCLCKLVFPSNIPRTQDYIGSSMRVDGYDAWLPEQSAASLKQIEGDISTFATAMSPPDHQTYHRWRTLTLSLLRRFHPEARMSAYFIHAAQTQCQKMSEIIYELSGQHPELDIDTMRDDMLKIFEQATLLSAELRTQKAAFEFRFPHSERGPRPGTEAGGADGDGLSQPAKNPFYVKYNSKWMDVDRKEDAYVDYVIAPAIFRSGNGEGERYDKTPSLFQSALVACFPPPSEKKAKTNKSSKLSGEDKKKKNQEEIEEVDEMEI